MAKIGDQKAVDQEVMYSEVLPFYGQNRSLTYCFFRKEDELNQSLFAAYQTLTQADAFQKHFQKKLD
jgi:hypothetical protein